MLIVIKPLYFLTLCAALSSCESTVSWNDRYNVTFIPEGHHNLDCTNDEATVIASGALKRTYPEHFERFQRIGFNDWAPIYGDYKGNMVQRFTYKTVLAYKILKSPPMQGSYKMESIEVSMSKSCEVIGVDYFKGEVEWIE